MNTAVLRQTNRRRVLQYLYDSGEPATKQEITVQRGEVRFLAIDMRVQELGCREVPLDFSHTAEYYETLSLYLEAFLDDFHLDRNRLLGVGITLPGIIDQTEGKLVMAPTLELWDIPLEELYRYFSRYPVFIENDANASGYAERWMEKGQNNMVYMALERGIGGAIFWGDKQYTGDHGRSGEFGHLRIVPNGRLCHCGRRGCLEAYCSVSQLGGVPGPPHRCLGQSAHQLRLRYRPGRCPVPLPGGAAAGDLLGSGREDPFRGGQLFPPPGPLRPSQRLRRYGPAVY